MRTENLAFFDRVSPQVAALIRNSATLPVFDAWDAAPPTPQRFLFRPPSIKTTNRHLLFDFAQDLYAAMAGETIDQEPQAGSGYLFLFGCPQNIDLIELVEETPVRGLVLCDSDPAAIAATADTVDWTRLADMLQARSGRIRFILTEGATLLATLMQDAVRDRNYGLIDGSYYRLGRPGADIEAVYTQFADHLPNLATSVGFFEDEVKMIGNIADNAAVSGLQPGQTVKVIAGNVRVVDDLTAVVIGSGPSAESALDRLADVIPGRAIILTAGTGLGVALSHGLEPHFHCEIENVDELQEVIDPISKKYDLSTIPLIGPSALSPHTVRYFGTHHSYIRDGTCASALYGDNPPILYHAAPTVANVAARIAIAMGARKIILIGVDFGTTDPAFHHAESSVYGTVPASDIPASLGFAPFDLHVPGNFGAPVLSSQSFMIGAQAMGQLFNRYPGRTVLNVGNGALIGGTIPCQIDQAVLAFDTAMLPHDLPQKLLSGIQVETPYTAWPDLSFQWSEWRQLLEKSLNNPEEHIDFISYYDSVTKAAFAPHTHIQLAALVYGTMMMMFQSSAYLALRLEPGRQKKLITIANSLIKKHFAVVDTGVQKIFTKLKYT